jgi:uncharacterized protein involved in exopolysaccharide biosynthesis
MELRAYLQRLWLDKWLFLGIFVSVLGATTAISLLFVPEEYATQTTVLLAPWVSERLESDTPPPFELPPPEIYKNLALAQDLLAEVLREVAPTSGRPRTIEALKRQMQVELVTVGQRPSPSRSALLIVTVRGRDPRVITKIAQLWAERFRWRSQQLLTSITTEMTEFLRAQLSEVTQALATQQEERQRYYQEHPVELWEAELWGLYQRREEILRQLETYHLELQNTRHPAMLQKTIIYLESEAERLSQEISRKVALINEARATLEAMDRHLEVLQRTSVAVATRLQQAQMLKAESAASPVRLLEPALVPQEPVTSRRLLYLALGTILGLFLALFVSSLKQYLTPL